MYKIIDYVTKAEVKPKDFVFAGETNPWEIIMDMEYIKKSINIDYFQTAEPRLLKYLPLMPIKNPSEFVSLSESATPLLKSRRLGKKLGIHLYFKIEGKNLTGSFKDRGSAVDVSIAREMGAKAIILASTGNMAASCSCYAAAAKLPCFVIVPEDVSMSKLAQVMSYGGKIIQVKGSYNDAAILAYQAAKRHQFYLGGDYAFRVEGQKTGAFELLDQLSHRPPDRIVIPIGCGTNIAAYAKGFDEYKSLGLIDRSSKLVGVQSTGANAVVNSFRHHSNTIEKLEKISTMATAIAVPDPIDGLKALDAIRQSDGEAYDVTDKEILEAQYLLATEEGLFVESASATTLAYLIKKSRNESIHQETIVCILTGDGLKEPSVVLKSATKPPAISPNIEEFTHLYESKLLSSKTMLFMEHDKTILSTLPNPASLSDLLFDISGIRYEKKYLNKIHDNINNTIQKGKKLSLSDLQDIIQDALQQIEDQDKVFSIVDFTVSTSKDKQSHANIKVKFEDNIYPGKGSGVGPVDAAIKSLVQACHELMSFELKNYTVDIRSQGADAIVYVEMKLVHQGLVSLGHAASPDIIQASLVAFENAYNGLLLQKGTQSE